MVITAELFAAFLQCKTKAYLYSKGTIGVRSRLVEWPKYLNDQFQRTGEKRLRSSFQEKECYVGTLSPEILKQRRYRLILDYTVQLPDIHVKLHGLELRPASCGTANSYYVPIRFISREKLTSADKLLLAFDALALSRISGEIPHRGILIHGHQYLTTTILLAAWIGKTYSLLERLAEYQNSAPPLILNRHCAECEFQSRCRLVAIEKDDLSLLASMPVKEQRHQNEKGIFTVTQLSYIFRPRKRPTSMPLKHHPAIKALAIRKKQIHVVGTPSLSAPGTPVYIDVEGDPDRDFYYLIGLRYKSGDSYVHHSFWADDLSAERDMWADCLRILLQVDHPRLIYYGSYETNFLKRMRSRYSDLLESLTFFDQLLSSSLNLLAITYAQVYFPTYSNGLKDIASYLGFHWSDTAASGFAALIWRSEWESSHHSDLKQRLILYNAEDCEAMQKVAEIIESLSLEQPDVTTKIDYVNVSLLKREYPQHFGEFDYALPEFQQINVAAYWDYQRSKVYVRSNPRLRGATRKGRKRGLLKLPPVNQVILVEEQRPTCCLCCKATLIYKTGRYSQVTYNLRFFPAGVKRWIVRYVYHRYLCWQCKATSIEYVRKNKYGECLQAYIMYQVIELHVPQHVVAQSIQTLFGFYISAGSVNRIKSHSAERYQTTYRTILNSIVKGSLIHADETRVKIGDKEQYVWVFTNLEEVAFVYSETREAGTVQEVLRDFSGVLVSDFYAAYDSLDCEQQKCLIHLMRDVNDDLRKQPFNKEMEQLAREFAALLRPMVETVDRFGLRAHYLRKHKKMAKQFFDALSRREYQTELANSYKKRFKKNQGKLFAFLDHDGIPWNNNNAEHAIKAFARLRNVIGANSTPKGIREYLTLLSICETCKYKEVSFLGFLRSGEFDVSAFAAKP